MKRKIIQLAGKTSVVSLPVDWVKKYNIRKGQEIDVVEKGRELIIRTNNVVEGDSIQINISSLDEQSIKWTLSALHKKGYDKITLYFDNPEVIYTIQDMVKDVLMGFVVMEQTSKKCVLKSISQDLETEFDSTLRRAFLVTRSLSQGLLGQINNPKTLNELLTLEKANNQLTNFCERILNKHGHKDPSKTLFYYVLVWNLEKVCDEYRDICKYVYENNLKLNKKVITLLRDVNNLFELFYTCFYRFDLTKIKEINNEKKKLLQRIEKFDTNLVIVYNLKSIITRISDFCTTTIAINGGTKNPIH